MTTRSTRMSKANFADMRATDKLGKRVSKIDKFVPPDIKMKLNTNGIDKEKMRIAMAPRARPKGGRAAKPTRKKTDIFALIDHGIEMSPTEEALARVAAEKAARDAPIPELLVKPKPPEPAPAPEPTPALLPEVKEEPKQKEPEKTLKPAIKPLQLDLDKPIKASKSRKAPKKSKSIDTDPQKKRSKRVSVRNLAPKRNKSVDEDMIEQKKKERKPKKSKSIEVGDDDRSRKGKKKKEKREKSRSIELGDAPKTSKKKEKRRSLKRVGNSRSPSHDSKSDVSLESYRSRDYSLDDSIPDFEAINAIKERRKNKQRKHKEPELEPAIDSFFKTPSSKDAQELKKEIDDVNDKIDETERLQKEELAKMKMEFEAKKKELDKEFEPQIQEIKDIIAKKTKTNENLQNGAQKISEKLRAENKKLRSEVDKYPPQILEMRQKNYTLEKTNKSVANTYEGLKKMAKKLEGDHEKLHVQNVKCRDEYLPKYRAELRMRQKHIDAEQEIKAIYRDTIVKISNRVTQTRDVELIEEITNMVIEIEGELNPKFDPKILFADESDSSDDDSDDDSDSDSD